ncbi:hypothetical protein, partial [uncultured Serinicoccus sp.]|uniref:hypothetical protein n=1 Tax=uncultured Serinicoccus sp. TaxID=735514 RepID=UPI0026136887
RIDLLRHGAHPPVLKQERHQTWGGSTFFIKSSAVDSTTPLDVEVTVSQDETPISGPTSVRVHPGRTQPNGPLCDPTAHVATVELSTEP